MNALVLAQPAAATARLRRLAPVAFCLAIVGWCLSQSPGKLIADTKLDLAIDPVGFLSRAADLWTAQWQFGVLQNQAAGYFFPMGPFFAAGTSAGVPAWIVQRLWMASLLCAAFLGLWRLARALEIGSPWARLFAAAVFALSPRALSLAGTVSAELLPYCVMPWALLPLVRGARTGSPRRAAALSGFAVVCMGGVNATAVFAAILPCAIFLVTRVPGPRRRQLMRWWVLAVILATLWWSAALVLTARFGFPFLPYTESAAVTTSTTSLAQTLRGASHWVGYLAVDAQPWWRAGWTLATTPALMVTATVLAALGLAGVARRDLPDRRFLLACLLAGAVLVGIGFSDRLGSPLAGPFRAALDGTLAPLRNVHKFDVLLRFALALGLAHVLSGQFRPARRETRIGLRIAATASVASLVAGVAYVGMPSAGSFTEIPAHWRAAAEWLDSHAGDQSTLLVPGSSFGEYTWGRPMDEPVQALMRSRWAVRSLVPGGSAGNARLLSAIDDRLSAGRASPGLAETLGRLGVRYLAVRNDLSRQLSGATWPILVHRTLDTSGGLTRVARFGPDSGAAPLFGGVLDYNVRRGYPAIEIYEVPKPAPVAAATEARGALRLTGGPESLLDLADAGLLRGRPVVLATDPAPPGGAQDVLTDSMRLREVDFGLVRDNVSPTLTTDALPRLSRAAHDLAEKGWDALQTAAVPTGVRRVSASSSAAEVGGPAILRDASALADAALDGDPATQWLTDGEKGVRGQWLEVEFSVPVKLPRITLSLATGADLGPPVTRVKVTTDTGSRTQDVPPGSAPVSVALPAGETRVLRVTLAGVGSGWDGRGARGGIREISADGRTLSRVLVLPVTRDAPDPPLVLLTRSTGERPACTRTGDQYACAPVLAHRGEEGTLTARQFTLARAYRAGVSGLAAPSPQLAGEIYRRTVKPAQITASSSWFADPVAAADALSDGDPGTTWWADPGDRQPQITIRWPGVRSVDGLSFALRDPSASVPGRVLVTSSAGVREADVDSAGNVRFPPLRTSELRIAFTEVTPRYSHTVGGVVDQLLPVGIGELGVRGVPGLVRAPALSTKVTLPCGQGPPLAVNGLLVPTRAEGTLDDVRNLRGLRYSACGDVALRGGANLLWAPLGAFAVDTAILRPSAPRTAAAAADVVGERQVVRRDWTSTRRVLDVGGGKESYLALTENANDGWRATLDGQQLTAVRLDGWRQAWLVPAGAGGQVTLTFAPGVAYLGAEAAAAVALLLLLLLALVPRRRRRPAPPPAPGAAGELRFAAVAAVSAAALLGGPGGAAIGVAALLAVRWRRNPWLWTAAPVLAGGVAQALARILSERPDAGSLPIAALGTAAQGCCVFALAALVAATGPSRRGTTVAGRWWQRGAPPPVLAGPPSAIEAGRRPPHPRFPEHDRVRADY